MEKSVSQGQTAQVNELQRNKFLTFWLILCIVATLITCPLSIFTANGQCIQIVNSLVFLSDGNYDLISNIQDLYFWLYVWTGIEGLFMIIGYAKILNWKKSGFWLIVGVRAVGLGLSSLLLGLISSKLSNSFVQFNAGSVITISVIMVVISVGVLWALLQLKKEGVSCWSQLK